MAFTPISWTYKEEATSTKLQTMVDNLIAHDHRADGTQGAALVGAWVNLAGVVAPGTGFSLTAGQNQRYRSLLGGVLIEVDFSVTRTGGDVVAGSVAAAKPGSLTDLPLVTGIPDAGMPSGGLAVDFANCFAYVAAYSNALNLASMVTSGKVSAGDVCVIRGVLWR